MNNINIDRIGDELAQAYQDGYENGRNELKNLVEDWAKDKDLLHSKNAEKQFMKFIEEVFEFKSEFDLVERTDHDKLREIYIQRMILEMGDIIVALIILCKQIDIDPIICLEKAYKKIAKRSGKTINGTFVKSEDLWWMQRCLLIPYKTFRDRIRIVNYYEKRGYYIEVWDGYIYCYRGK